MRKLLWMAPLLFVLHGCSPSGEVELSKEEDKAHEEFLSHGFKVDKVPQGAKGGGAPQNKPLNVPSG